jgi:hypothetical protein
MITGENIKLLEETGNADWISALESASIKGLIDEINDQSLFDERNHREFLAPKEFPGGRLITRRNPSLAIKRAKTKKRWASV